jgi:CAAX prenyl protease-like protein
MTSPGDGAQSAAGSRSDALVRCLPFGVFIGFLALMSFLPEAKPAPAGEIDWRWVYGARTVVVGALLILLWRRYSELRLAPKMSAGDWGASILVGVAIFGLWIVLDEGWMVLGSGESAGFDPRRHGTEELHLPLTVLRLVGLAVVVPLA